MLKFETKKEHIIISRIISSRMGPMSTGTLHNYKKWIYIYIYIYIYKHTNTNTHTQEWNL